MTAPDRIGLIADVLGRWAPQRSCFQRSLDRRTGCGGYLSTDVRSCRHPRHEGEKGMKPLGWLIGGWIFLVLSVWSLITDSPRADEAAFAAVFCFAVEQIIGEIRAMKGTKG